MELTELEYFLVVSRMEHITNAADKLHITQPALSKAISRLENDLGVDLFERSGKRVRLNEYGGVVVRYAEKIFSQIEDMKKNLDDLSEATTGRILFASSMPTREPSMIFSCTREYMLSHPKVQMCMYQMNLKDIKSALESRTIDMAITTPDVTSPGIEWRKLFSERMGIILSHRNPLAQRHSIHIEELRNEKFLCNNSNSDVQDLTYHFCERAGFTPEIYFEGYLPEFIGEAISKNLGVSFISEKQFKWNAEQKDRKPWENNIRFVEVEDDFCERSCGIAVCGNRYMPRATSEFHDYLIKSLKEA